MASNVEYRVRAVTRYVITEFRDTGELSSVRTLGLFDNQQQADHVAGLMAKAEAGATFAATATHKEPRGTFHAETRAQCDALMRFIHSGEYAALPKD